MRPRGEGLHRCLLRGSRFSFRERGFHIANFGVDSIARFAVVVIVLGAYSFHAEVRCIHVGRGYNDDPDIVSLFKLSEDIPLFIEQIGSHREGQDRPDLSAAFFQCLLLHQPYDRQRE